MLLKVIGQLYIQMILTMNKNKLYILIDKNLNPIYGAVQGCHAACEWLLQHWQINKVGDPVWDWSNAYLIYLSVDIEQWKEKLWRFDPSKYKWTWFDEPDLDNQTTAIAVYEKDFPSSIIQKLKKEELLK